MSKPQIHFAHANGVPSACYSKLFRDLTTDFDIKTLPVLGTDPRYPIRDNWHELTDQIADSIREKCTGPVIGMGHSAGGLCTFFAAHRYPELFRAVVIMDPPVVNGFAAAPFAFMKWMGQADRITPSGKSVGRRDHWPSRDEARASLGRKKFFQEFDTECFEDYLKFALTDVSDGVRLTVPVDVEVGIFRTTPTDAWRYRFPLKVPGVFLAGAQSDFVKAGFGARMARHHRMDYRLVDGGHMFPLENPGLTVAAIREGLAPILAQGAAA